MLDVALKEWSIVCDLLLEGRLAVLLRKGGIHEERGPGRFSLEYDRFALFPAWEHQKPEGMKEPFRGRVERFEEEPRQVPLKGYAEVKGDAIWPIPSREAFDQLDDLHVWDESQIDMRFHYKPDRPIYLLAPRVFRFPEPRIIPNRDAYRGCRSWVPLESDDVVDEAGATPAMTDEAYAAVIERIRRAMGGGGA